MSAKRIYFIYKFSGNPSPSATYKKLEELFGQGYVFDKKYPNAGKELTREDIRRLFTKDMKEGNILFGAVDNILVKGDKLIVLDYKTKGFPIKDEKEAADYYQNQLNLYNFLLRKNGYKTEDYGFLLFYIPDEVTKTGEVIFDTLLVKRQIDVDDAEKLFKEALDLLKGDCPEKCCEWCEGR